MLHSKSPYLLQEMTGNSIITSYFWVWRHCTLFQTAVREKGRRGCFPVCENSMLMLCPLHRASYRCLKWHSFPAGRQVSHAAPAHLSHYLRSCPSQTGDHNDLMQYFDSFRFLLYFQISDMPKIRLFSYIFKP